MIGSARSSTGDAPRGSRIARHVVASIDSLTLLTAAVLVVATIVLAGQPIYANDTWIHLALGRAFATDGPWLARDPYLFAAIDPPSPSSWLGSVAIYGAYLAGGFIGLRITHALSVLLILALAWHLLRRSGASSTGAAAGVAGFVVLATYRLVQLRPDLFTIVAVLLLYPTFVRDRAGPDRQRILIAGLLGAIWANVHAAFVLGPLLLLGCAAFVFGSSFAQMEEMATRPERARAGRIASAGLAMLVASCLNPQGVSAVFAYAASGTTTPGLESVSDEWNPTRLFTWPLPFLPPTLAAWILIWLCLIGVAVTAVLFVRQRLGHDSRAAAIDPALLALAIGGLVAAVWASRFLWLGVFALTLLGTITSNCPAPESEVEPQPVDAGRSSLASVEPPRLASPPSDKRVLTACLAAIFTLAAAVLHVEVGDWPLVSRAMHADEADYRTPYSAERFNTTAVWLLADMGVEGRIFNDYPLGGFMSFWLAPKLMMSSSGTMNVARAAMEANFAIGARQQIRQGETYADLLDRQGIDLFLGLGFPIAATPGRPIPCTVRHLEHESGWMLVFRNLRSAVYLRRNARNSSNLARIASFYAQAGVQFDRERGFDPGLAIQNSPAWALRYGLIPADFEPLVTVVENDLREGRVDFNAHRLASLYAVLGLYDRALTLDRRIQRITPNDADTVWRMVWTFAQIGRWKDAFGVAAHYERTVAPGASSGAYPWSTTIERMRSMNPAARATLVAHLPLLRADQLGWVRDQVGSLPPRTTTQAVAP